MNIYQVIYPDGCEGYFNTLSEAKKEVVENARFWDYNIDDYEINEFNKQKTIDILSA